MILTNQQKQLYINNLVSSLSQEKEILRIVIFGSFINSENPNDIDVAVIQNSEDNYLNLAMKYRSLVRAVSNQIPIDIIPVKDGYKDSFIMREIKAGEIIYKRPE